MTAVLPVGYVTILEAAEMLQPAMYAGVPDLPIVIKLRQEGIEVNDGPAINRAVAELWKAVDKGALRSMAIGGRPSSSCKSRCAMHERRSRPAHPPGRGFTLLRQSNPAYHELATWFGPLLHGATLAFRGDGCPERTDRGNRARADCCSPGASTRTTSQNKAIATNYESALMLSEGPCTSS
jgi:hypothetical protein